MPVNMEEFLLPSTPVKRLAGSESNTPLSPDMKNARYRLGNLLSGIRKGDIGTYNERDEDADQSLGFGKRGPGRPKRPKRERRIIFELRSKPFSLRDSYEYEGIYPMMRKWIFGRDDELNSLNDDPVSLSSDSSAVLPKLFTMEDSLDLLATKEIHRMPDPLPATREQLPMAVKAPDRKHRLPEGSDTTALLKEHLTGWKTCRKQHSAYMDQRERRFDPSLRLLKTVHSITQQTNQ